MKLTLVRHGETEENVAGILQGQLPGHLTAEGKRQAARTAEQLRHIQFDAIYCSDLKRCLDTAEPIRASHLKVPFYTEMLLRERYGGDLQGRPLSEEQAMFKDDDWYTHKPPGGGESWEDVRARQKIFLNDLYASYPNGNFLVIAHGGSVRGIRSLLEHKTLEAVSKEGTPNGGVWQVEMDSALDV